ncbi:MAG TPA: hypothetical protein VFL61_01550 [Gaiellaceae bacterium]|nr:hypothetical protein [Gaiellaceae bacterium]
MAVVLARPGQTAELQRPDKVVFKGNFSYGKAAAFDRYGLYAPGPSFGGMPLVAVTRRLDAANPRIPANAAVPKRADWVNFIYASGCAYDEFGIDCDNMAQVQVWPACERNLHSYEGASLAGDIHPEPVTVRGVPSAFFKDDTMLEIYSGDSTIVLFARSEEQLFTLADELLSVNAGKVGNPSVERKAALPPPAQGAMTGTLECRA